MKQWIVKRHGGRSSDNFRPIYAGGDEQRAREIYARTAEALRQGTVQLIRPDGSTADLCTAARVRSRW